MLDLFITPQFQKDIKKIPTNIISRTDAVILVLRENPIHKALNIKKLKGFKLPVWRVRIESYRLIYTFNKKSLTLHRICHRKDIYKNI